MGSEASIATGNEPFSFNSGYQIPTQPQSPYRSSQALANPSTSFPFSPPVYNSPQTSTISPLYQESFPGPRNLQSHFEEKPQQVLPTTHSYTPGQSPRLVDLLLPGTNLNTPPPEYKQYRPRQSDIPYQPACDLVRNLDDDVEEIIRDPDDFMDTSEAFPIMDASSPSGSSSSSDNSIFDFGSQISEALWHAKMQLTIPYLYKVPSLLPGSPESLFPQFHLQTCGILSIKDGPGENPWREMILPLAQESAALWHAVSAMAALHIAKQLPEMFQQGLQHMTKSGRHFSNDIAHMKTETALATTLALAFAMSWDHQLAPGGNPHIRGAKTLFHEVVKKYNKTPPNSKEYPRLRFLCNTWLYVSVIAQLTSLDDGDSNELDVDLPSNQLPQFIEIDPLLGSARSLFPLIGGVASVIRKVRNSDSNSMDIYREAEVLQTAVENWMPPSGEIPKVEDPSLEVQHSVQTAQAYRWATLLYLHQAVPEIPSRTTADLAHRILQCLKSVPVSSRAIVIQIFPLMAAGCEAVGENRNWVKHRWDTMRRRMKIGNLDRCWDVVKEVWRLRDADEVRRSKRGLQIADSIINGTNNHPAMKRKMRSETNNDNAYFVDWADGCDDTIKRRATTDTMFTDDYPLMMDMGCETLELEKVQSAPLEYYSVEDIDPERTVRGRLHWIGVMGKWKWEGEQLQFFSTFSNWLEVLEILISNVL